MSDTPDADKKTQETVGSILHGKSRQAPRMVEGTQAAVHSILKGKPLEEDSNVALQKHELAPAVEKLKKSKPFKEAFEAARISGDWVTLCAEAEKIIGDKKVAAEAVNAIMMHHRKPTGISGEATDHFRKPMVQAEDKKEKCYNCGKAIGPGDKSITVQAGKWNGVFCSEKCKGVYKKKHESVEDGSEGPAAKCPECMASSISLEETSDVGTFKCLICGKTDTVTARTIREWRYDKGRKKELQEGAVKKWLEDKIIAACEDLDVPDDMKDEIEDAVFARMMEGTLGDGEVSEQTATAIGDLVAELAETGTTGEPEDEIEEPELEPEEEPEGVDVLMNDEPEEDEPEPEDELEPEFEPDEDELEPAYAEAGLRVLVNLPGESIFEGEIFELHNEGAVVASVGGPRKTVPFEFISPAGTDEDIVENVISGRITVDEALDLIVDNTMSFRAENVMR